MLEEGLPSRVTAPDSRSVRRLNLVLMEFSAPFTGSVTVLYSHRTGIEATLTACEVVGARSVAYLPETRVLVMAGDTIAVMFTGTIGVQLTAAIQLEIL